MKEPSLLPDALKSLQQGQLLINEFFHSIQGESSHAGRPCFFIRLAGCQLRCTWCDTKYSFHEGRVYTVDECVEEARASSARLVELTGGEPLLQPSVYPLMQRLCDAGFEVLLETSGSIGVGRVDPRVKRIVDWKCPGSGMERHNQPSILSDLKTGDELKLVLNDRSDYEWARRWLGEHAGKFSREVPVHFSPVHGRLSFEELAQWILEDGLPVRLNLQIHKWIWAPDRRGV